MDYQKAIQSLDTTEGIHLVLGGGALKGVAHIPLLEFLEKEKIQIKAISGTSAGALIGALYASGRTPAEILNFFLEHPLFRYEWMTPFSNGMLNSMKYKSYFEGNMEATFEELSMPLYVCATDMIKGQSVYFSEGELWHKILASCAVPGIFRPVEVEGVMYSDGAVMDNFPVHPFKNKVLPIIGSFLRSPGAVTQKDLSNTRKVLKRSIYLQRQALEAPKLQFPDVCVVHQLNHYSAFKKKDAIKMYELSQNLFS